MANMIPLTAFFPLTKPFAPSVPDPVAEQMLRLAAIEFCERTRAWRHIINRRAGGIDECGPPFVKLFPPYATIFEFEFAYFNGQPLDALQFSEVDVRHPDDGPDIGPPRYITQTAPGHVRLLPMPDAAGTLNMSVFLKPISMDDWEGSAYDMADDDDLNVLPDFLLTQYGETISHGALARIMALPNQTYTDPGRSEFYRLSFAARLDTGFQTNLRGQQRAQPRSKPASSF